MTYKRETIKAKGHKWAYLKIGKGEPIVLLHGIINYADFYIPLAEELSRYFEVIVPDLPGFGYTNKYTPNSYQNIAAGLSDFTAALKLKNLNIFGSSMGGLIAIEYTSLNKDNVKNLIVHAVPWEKGVINLTLFEKFLIHDFFYHAKKKDLSAFQKVFVKNILPVYETLSKPGMRLIFSDNREKIKESLERLDMKGTIEVMKSMEDADLDIHLGRIDTNSLVIISELDDRLNVVNEIELSEKLGSKRFVIVKNSTHDLPMGNPETTSKIILSFLGKEDYNSKNLIWGKIDENDN